MSTAVNFSSLQLTTTAASTDRLLLRNSSALSGASGFNQISVGNIERTLTVYSTVQSNSATNWNYQGTDIKALTGNWQNTYSTVNSQSANWVTPSIFSGTLSAATYIASITSTNTTSYVLVSGDASRTIIDTASTTTTYSVPANSVTSFAIGTQIIFIQGNKNASNYTRLSAGVGVTINSFASSLSLGGNYAAGTLIKTGTNTWYLIGNLA